MVRFLLHRPIAVIMAFLALVILGCVTFTTLPVSLLPDVAIPHITVQLTGENMSARELESTMVTPLRRQLMQVSGLDEIQSETRDGSAIIRLDMDYGVDTDLAFIEVNEKIDAAMNSLPRDTRRPKAIKASATDIPVLYLYMTSPGGDFIETCEVAENIVRRRLEQLPQVAMADVTGIPGKTLRIVPDIRRMMSAGITISDIQNVLDRNNAEPGSMTVRDGYYEYNIHIANQLRTPDDVRAIKMMKNGMIHTLGDICEVTLVERSPEGYTTYGNERAVAMALLKSDAASMDDMEDAVDEAIEYFTGQYPGIVFTKSRSQTELLDFTISNLEQNLILGLILVFIVCVLFMHSLRMPFIIGITIIVAVVITFLLFFLFRVSINIISLAGLILAVGMMIDNSVIVAENITQMRERGMPLADSCVAGTNEMITPMLSSSLTTVAVFVPLVFMSGIAGAIFADQAFSITAGLAASYVAGITLLPVMYYLFYRKAGNDTQRQKAGKPSGKLVFHTDWYDRGIDFIFAHKTATIIFVIVTLAAIFPLFRLLDTERMPHIDSSETLIHIDWNENINIDENLQRTRRLSSSVDSLVTEHSAYVGLQDYMLGDDAEMSSAESEIYFRIPSPDSLDTFKEILSSTLRHTWPGATYEYAAPANVFEKVFTSGKYPLEARFTLKNPGAPSAVDIVLALHRQVDKATGINSLDIPLREQINITVDHELCALYNVDESEVRRQLAIAFEGSHAATLRSYQDYVPIHIGADSRSVADVLAGTLVDARPDSKGNTATVPMSALVHTSRGRDFKTITASASGEYIPVDFNIKAGQARDIMAAVSNVAASESEADVSFTGSIFSNERMMRELTVILLVSLLMMYFILCAQFESFVQPLIVLVEIPVDIAFALLSLWLCGQTLNLMSAIGIIVTCGIVVNDSILKIDSINELRKDGMPLFKAIHTAGNRRLKPILMTSITTIMAMVPVLFTSDMGSELQRPLATAMIGSMLIGTLVSIFVIPLLYYLIYHKRHVATPA